VKRRDFLKLSGAAAMTWGLGRADWAHAAQPDLAVVQGPTREAVRKAVELMGGMKRFVKPGHRVVIKPNMSFPSSAEQGANTTPQAVSELARLCWQAGAAKVLVLDNPLGPAERCLDKSGILEACQAVKRGMVHMVESPDLYEKVSVPKAQAVPRIQVMKEVLKADVLIAAPTAKSHSGAGVSLSMKGMMGLVRDRGTFHSSGLAAGIVDLVSVVKAQLTVIDATRVLTSGGPHGPGKLIAAKTIIASTDMVAADAYSVAQFEWYGRRYEPRQVPHIKLAHQRGLGRMDFENLKVSKVVL